ncbi:MAG: hypothetical protein AAFO04_29035 [Cyanobacteria bacterium J06592_8]
MAETILPSEQVSPVYFGLGRFSLRTVEESDPYTMPAYRTSFTNNIHRHDPGSLIIHETRKERKALGLDFKNVHVKEYLSYSTINGNDKDNDITGAQPTRHTWSYKVGLGGSGTSNRSWDGTFDDEINGGKGNDVIQGLKGNDTLRGEEGNDALRGGEGSDSLDGGEDSDLLYTGPLTNGEMDTLTGGANADTFFLGDATPPPDNDPVTTGKGFNWGKLGLSIAGDISDLFFTAIPILTPFKKTKEVVPMLFDVAKATSDDVTAAVEKEENVQEFGSATITDFNPTEDVIFIPLPSDGDIYIDENSTGTNLFKVFHDTNKTDVIATVELSNDFNNLEGNSNGKLQSSWFDILERNALILDSSGAQNYKDNTQLNIAPEDIENLGTNKFLVLGAYSGFDVKGSNSADYSYGTQFGDVLYGYEESAVANTAGNDVMYGFEGDDVFFPGQGNDRIDGGDGSDTANYMDSTSGIIINLENGVNNDDGFGTKDILNSIENIFGSKHDDNITGDDKDNVLASREGNDTLTGNGGNDTFMLSSGEKTIKDFNPADDKIQIDIQDYYDASNNQVSFDVNHSEDILTISVSNQTINLYNIVSSEVADVLKNIEFIGTEKLRGTNNQDILIGNDSNNNIANNGGSDYAYGGGGNDWLGGQNGNDVLIGGDGFDVLQGYQGNDTLIGGAGNDNFAFRGAARSNGIDTILDFSASEGDLIRIDQSAYGISDLGAVSFDNSTNELSVNNSVIAVLENPSGFSVDNSVSLFN